MRTSIGKSPSFAIVQKVVADVKIDMAAKVVVAVKDSALDVDLVSPSNGSIRFG
jgi:hypothetical protein